MFRNWEGRVLAVGVLVLLLVSWAPAGATPSHVVSPSVSGARPSPVAPSPGTSLPSAGPQGEAQHLAEIESTLRARGVPASAIHLPDLLAATPGRSGPVAPTYANGPAPMGISDLGLRNVSGTLAPYRYNSSSVWGTVGLTKAQSVYVDGDGPDMFGIQLNAVATNVTLFGSSTYEFWTQNFVSYTSGNESLSFGDNVWNFSSNQTDFTPNALAAHGPNGTVVSPVYYYANGPTFKVAYPFTLNLYLNASTIKGDAAVFFNYSVTATNGSWSGSFDYVAFNSMASGATLPVPEPAFQVNGTGVDPVGLPNDFEIVLVGNDDGDTTTFVAMNATLALRYWNATAGGYRAVPAAYDAGSDTGETSNGILPTYATPPLGGAPTVSVGLGPSYVQGLWNVSDALNGSREVNLSQKPQNAFLFVTPGTAFNASTAQWVPTLESGATTTEFSLPRTGSYQLEWMLSGYTAIGQAAPGCLVPLLNCTVAVTVNLTAATAAGSYTPLLAWGNSELAAIAQSGTGRAASPYVLFHHPVGGLDAVFGQLNDFGFPVFSAVLLVDTTDYVRVTQVPATVAYGSWIEANLSRLDLPATNELQLEFWNVTHVAVSNSTDLSGWLSSEVAFFPAGEVLFWASTDNLVASNTFRDQGVGIALYGGSANTIWGNTFVSGAVRPSFYYGNNSTGILEWESGDLVYNNYFAVDQGALTPTADALSCQFVCAPATYADTWNVSLRPASDSTTVLGETLSGSILHTGYQGGNYWSNYGDAQNPFGVLPFNDSGLITGRGQGDYVPLYPSTLYNITFVEVGLAPGLTWNVTAGGVTTGTITRQVNVSEPNGSYAYSVSGPAGYLPPAVGAFTVNGTNLTVPLAFTELFSQAVAESGLVSGWTWNVTFVAQAGSGGTNASASSTTADASVSLTNGTYSYHYQAYGYAATPAGGRLVVDGSVTPLSVGFALVPILTVEASGLASGIPWTVNVTQGSSELTVAALGDAKVVLTVLELNPGPFTWTVHAANYTASPSTGSGVAPHARTAQVAFAAIAPPAGPAAPFDWTLVLVGVLAVLAVAGFAFYARERGRRPPPAPAAPAGTTPAPIAPWEETDSDAERPPAYSRAK